MKPGTLWKIVSYPDGYHDLLGPVEGVEFSDSNVQLDGVHVFTRSAEEVEQAILTFKDQIKPNGMIWVSWYKKSSKIPTDVTEDVIRDTAIALGLVDVKVCAVSAIWSGLKVVWRKENR